MSRVVCPHPRIELLENVPEKLLRRVMGEP